MRKTVAIILLSLSLGGCWPATETYFSSSAPGGRQSYVCGGDGYKLQFNSANVEWALLTFYPLLLSSGGMHLHFRVEDDLSALHRAGERAAAHLPDSTQRWHARVDFAKANSVREKTVQLSGTVMVTWPPNQRFDIPVTPDFSPFIVPNFSGDIAIVTMPVLTIDGRSETFPPVTVQRRTGVTMGGVNGC